MRKQIVTFLIFVTLILSTTLVAQTDVFQRSAVIPVDTLDVGGLGGVISGVDFDGDGLKEIYSVNNDWEDIAGKDWTPRIHKYENDGSGWAEVWSTELTFLGAQNTWPALTYGDWDNDGKMEIIFGPVNNGGAGDSIYTRVTVYESLGDGSDVMGIDNGDGSYDPNARWWINDTPDYNLRPFVWLLSDIDNDSDKELIFAARAGAERFGVISVSDIPDNGDGSEVWDLEVSALTDTNLVIDGGTIYDMNIIDNAIFLIHTSGNVTPVLYLEGSWVTGPILEGAVPGGSWKSSSVVDIDGDGTQELIVNGFGSSSPTTHLLQYVDGVFSSTVIADLAPHVGAGGRLYGGDTGDIDGDGNLDYVFGTRNSTPNAAIFRLEYQGGAITDPANYQISTIDDLIFASGGRYDVISLGNLDDDADLEIVYTGIPATAPVPLVVLDYQQIAETVTSIADVKVDANEDYLPDNDGTVFSVIGVVSSINFTATSNRFSYNIQDGTAGINITKGSEDGGGTVYDIGDRLLVTGTLGAYAGTTQLDIADLATDVSFLDAARIVKPISLSIADYFADPESYESRLITLTGIAPTADSDAWPAGGSANLTMWDGSPDIVTLRVDSDTDLDENVAPTFPADITGIATQYSFDTPPNTGYQISPNSYADFVQDIAVAPSPYFSLLTPENGAVITISDNESTYDLTSEAATDLNNDVAGYQFKVLPDIIAINSAEPIVTVSATDVLDLMAGADSIDVTWTVLVLDATGLSSASIDTFTVTFVRDPLLAVDDDAIPTQFYADQNYPNPFNPTTSIKFGLPSQSVVDLRIYDILGREVSTIVNNEALKAGNYSYNFDASALASGTYIYRLTNGNNVVSKKMLLLK